MKNLFILLILNVLYTHFLFSQIIEDFADGNLGTAPAWQGDTSDFVINSSGQLQLNASQAGISAISTKIDSINVWQHNMEWNFQIRLAFSPSNNNFARFYVLADTSDLKSAGLQGFYLQFGENLSQDAIELFYTDGQQNVSILRGTDAFIANSFNIKVKLIRTHEGEWRLYVDETDLNWYHLQASATFNQQISAKAVGIYCKYTVGNSNKFYLDDIYIGPQRADSVPPTITSCHGQDDFRTVAVAFSEIVDDSGLNPRHYKIQETNANPIDCEYMFPDYQKVMLFFPNTFEEDSVYHLHVSNVRDLAGNNITDTLVRFHCHKIKRNDVLIHEIMADPTPAVGLPPVEYLELFNRTDGVLLLDNWKIQLGKTLRTLPEITLGAHGFAVITAEENVEQLSALCQNIYSLSSLSITDGGQEIILLNNYDEIIHIVKFKNSWHRNSIKREGGWSLEMIDSQNPCAEENNWDSSTDESGGTPGRPNSITRENRDFEPPLMIATTVIDSNQLRVHFSETISISTDASLFTIDHDLNIIDIKAVSPYNNALDLRFDQTLQTGIVYQLTIYGNICDCAGLSAQYGQSISFGLDQKPRYKDLVINEILTNPTGNEDADYIEIYNRSSKIIDLKKVKIGSGGGDLPEKTAIAVGQGYQLFPQQMVALCKNRKLTEEHYNPLYPQLLLPSDSLPAFPNAEGTVWLTDLALQVIDRFQYDEKMHNPMLSSTDGVSLERVHHDADTQDANNWKSAAANVGFGTPGYTNSQAAELLSTQDALRIEPEIFSPDNDGFEDFAEIYCRFKDAENRVSVAIYHRDGMLIKKLAHNEVCGGEARYLWDGNDEDGHLVSPDLYIVRMQYWNLSGKKRSKQAVVGLR